MSPKKVRDEVAVLLSEVEIGPYQVRPWSFGRFKKVYPALAGIIPALKALDLDFSQEQAGETLQAKAGEIIGALLPALTPLIALTLEIPAEEVDDLPFDQAAALGLTIISQNLSLIKNSLPLIIEQVKTVVRGG